MWPDILCVGKGLSSGYAPLSAVLLTEKVGAAFWGDAADGVQYQAGHTFAGNPVSAACGLAVIRYFEEHGVLENVRARGAELAARLAGSRAATRSAARSAGGAALLHRLRRPRHRRPARPDQPLGTAVQQAARRRGLLLRASTHNATLAPPLIVGAADVTEIADIFEESIAEVAARLEAGGRRQARRRLRPVSHAAVSGRAARRRSGDLRSPRRSAST